MHCVKHKIKGVQLRTGFLILHSEVDKIGHLITVNSDQIKFPLQMGGGGTQELTIWQRCPRMHASWGQPASESKMLPSLPHAHRPGKPRPYLAQKLRCFRCCSFLEAEQRLLPLYGVLLPWKRMFSKMGGAVSNRRGRMVDFITLYGLHDG